jgi:hypothetical protein
MAKSGAVAGAVVAASVLIAAPQASASTSGGSVKGYSGQPTAFGSVAACQHVFTGSVTAQYSGRITAGIGNVTFNFCKPGTSITAKGLPWTLNLDENRSYTLNGVQVNITTYRGTCLYGGTLNGFMQYPGVYDLRGSLTRQSGACGGSDQINVSNIPEVISVSG